MWRVIGAYMQQRTIQNPIKLEGIGLHSGKAVQIRFLPAPINHGIKFLRSDLTDAQPIPAIYQAVTDTMMSSNLTNALGQRIGTVEHLMSAIAALAIDNLQVEVSAPEVPIMDGSAIQFIEVLQQAGIAEQVAAKQYIQVIRPVEVRVADKIAGFRPYDGFVLDFQIEFNHPAFDASYEKFRLDFNEGNFIEHIAKARTFGFLKDIEHLKSNNLGLGGSMDNAIVLDDSGVLNPEGLRYADEFVRHKVLDAIGDLYLAGHQILGEFYAYKSGHALNNQLLKALFSDESNYKVVTKYDSVN